MRTMKSKKGITLIALVISIIILVILSAVSINILIGQDGIITKAREGEANYKNAEQAEQETLLETEDTMKSILLGEIRLPDLLVETNETKQMITKWNITSGDEIQIYVYYASDYDSSPIENNTNFTINWGDGTQEAITSANMQYDEYGDGYITHTYASTNANTLITIDGICKTFSHSWNDKLTEIVQWGATGLKYFFADGNAALTTIAVPTKNSFKNMMGFAWAFNNCDSLTSIPENLFANASNIKTFMGTFSSCDNLTAIPLSLFANCQRAEIFNETFNGCQNLTGNAPELWKRIENGEETEYEAGTLDGLNCFDGCYSLDNYRYIPVYWGGLGQIRNAPVIAEEPLPDLPEETALTRKMITKWNIESGNTVRIFVTGYENGGTGSTLNFNFNFTVNWGDGTIETISSIANTTYDNTAGKQYISHTYSISNSSILITIDGQCNVFDTTNWMSSYNLTEVVQWGATGLECVLFMNNPNLTKVAVPTKNSFANIESFKYAFRDCNALIEVPENLFANCPIVTSFENTFDNCVNLITVPNNLFTNCSNVTNFKETFTGCTGLIGNAPNLWRRVPDGENNGYQGTPDGVNCFNGCNQLSNYKYIPYYWKSVQYQF